MSDSVIQTIIIVVGALCLAGMVGGFLFTYNFLCSSGWFGPRRARNDVETKRVYNEYNSIQIEGRND